MALPKSADFILKDIDFIPFKGSLPNFSAGFFKEGRIIPQSLLTRQESRRTWSSRVPVYVRPGKRVNGEYLFGGYLFAHYGHFLLESLSRIRGMLRYEGLPTVFFSHTKQFPCWQNAIFGILGPTNKIILAHEPMQFECVVFTEPECILHYHIADAMMDTMGRYVCRGDASGKNVWLSRRQCPGGGLTNEAVIEDALSRRGWEIYHPQDHSVAQQVEVLAGARNVAGLDGSAFYTLLLARTVASNVLVISRRGFIPALLTRVLEYKKIRHQLHIPKVVHVGERGANARFEAQDPEGIIRFVLDAAL